ncbi:immunity protein Tsi6 family protein [Candidatus Pantoea multigeneris]|uniref:Tsi6 domain-containing protein n=1 Tax=Candidatus Pantoea multigeneris TaxID=2608357 RepID=A0ABX0R475_9GAMM|nr:immunity protein Tsi6 family protein [Pantoea multigeneris]NIF20211.1 hypothetical protein [Pantoea multigeneris]
MNNDTAVDYVERALRLAQKRAAMMKTITGGAALEPMYDSIVNQLIFLSALLSGQENDKSKIHTMTIGIYAAKEFAETDPIFADRLFSASFIADQIGRGLKVRLPHTLEEGYEAEQHQLQKTFPDDFDV